MSWWHRRSIRTRLAVMAAAVMALLCTAMAVFIVLMVRQTAIDHRTEQLFTNAINLGAQLRRSVPDLHEKNPGQAVQVFDPAGAVVAATPGMAGRPPMTNLRPDPDAYATTTTCDAPTFAGRCVIGLAYPVHRADGLWQLDVAVPAVPWYVSPQLIVPLATSWVLLVAAAAVGSHRIVGKTLQPVCSITHTLAQITSSDLRHRVPVPKYRDELRDLAQTANRTLDRAQAAVERQLRFASDASHDLRSPLTAIRTRIEEALIEPREADWPRTGEALLDSVDRMQALIGDLLQVARLDAGVTARHEPVDLTGLVAGELDRRAAKAELRRRLTPGVTVEGSRIELSRLLNNLIDNAERHAASAVTVTLTLEAGQAVLEVSDDGEGIAIEQREAVFQRFTRLEASRARDPGGTGLGLPIARQLAEAHGGTLTVEDSVRGARFVLRLPVYAPSPPQC
ncbi:HAMP domain-containing protein [Herbidospora sp. NEAU-GS84]|uniref:histidine kinase n=1 Tax=Herbidospora solisilvae TaxID=2696284 RepID=A0A7C9N0J4_9ACTN|nr:HAMP domain-containing sensor histidine kinase [Herbidospora solisilvae]NAS25791.1 HAMP domain-containing protein [Herbidospora solisilvae]